VTDGQIKNKARLCLTPRNYRLKYNQVLTWWECGENKSQLWTNPVVDVKYPEAPNVQKRKREAAPTAKKAPRKPDAKRFGLFNRVKTQFRVFASPQKNGDAFVAKISSENNGWRQEFFFDARTKSIRIASMPDYALSNADKGGL